jgi:hypothetical protein
VILLCNKSFVIFICPFDLFGKALGEETILLLVESLIKDERYDDISKIKMDKIINFLRWSIKF